MKNKCDVCVFAGVRERLAMHTLSHRGVSSCVCEVFGVEGVKISERKRKV